MFKGTCSGKALLYFYFSFLLIDTGIEMNNKIFGKENLNYMIISPSVVPKKVMD